MESYPVGRFALGALWVFCLLGLTLWWLKKKKGSPFSKAQNKLIEVLEVYPLGLKNRMMLLQVDGHRILVSVNAQEVKTLHTWTPSIHHQQVDSVAVSSSFTDQLIKTQAQTPDSASGVHTHEVHQTSRL